MEETEHAQRPRLWVISEPFYPDENTTAFHMTRFAEGLSEHFDVKALCGQPSYSSRGVKAPKRELHNGVDIYRSAGTTLDKDVFLFRLTNMMTLGATMFVNALRFFKKGDRVLAVTAPPTLQFITAAAALTKGASYSLLMYDVYPDAIIAAGKMKRGSFVARSIDLANRWLYKHAAKIFVIGRDMESLMAKKSEGLDIPIVIVPNCAETDFIEPRPKTDNALLKELGLSQKFVLLYSGNMGRTHDLESILECAASLADRPDVHFLFIGDGGKKKWLEEQKRDRNLTNVTILGLKPRAEQPVFLNACDVSLISLNRGMNGISVPSRTYNVMAAGKPIIAVADEGSELSLLVEEEQIGWRIDPQDHIGLAALITRIAEDPSELSDMGARARRAAEEKYTFPHSVAKYVAALS